MNATTQTLAEIVIQRPEAAQVLARHRLDFCCHGHRTLVEACAERSLDPAKVLAEIAGQAPPDAPVETWTDRPLAEVIDHIVTRYHDGLRRDLPALVEMAQTVERVHADKANCPRGLASHLQGILAAVEDHLMKEEGILFPMIRSGRGAMAFMPIKVMEQEHVEHAENLAKTREMAHDLVPPPEACATWRALYDGLARLEIDLFRHIHLENYVLFPRALAGGGE